MGPQLATAASFAAMGAKVGGDVLKGYGGQQSQEWQAAKDKRAAEIGRLRADQLGTQMTEELRNTLGNISAIRSASNIDALSPTTDAINAEERRVGERERNIKVGNLLEQSRENDLSAGYHQWAGRMSLIGGFTDAAGDIAKYGSTWDKK